MISSMGNCILFPSRVASWFTKYDYPSVLRNLKTALAGSCVLVTYIEGLDVYVACTGDRLDDLM